MLKIIHVFRSPVGGIFRHVRDLLAEQSANGHQVGIICDSTTGGAFEERIFEEIMPSLKLGLYKLPIPRAISHMDLLAFFKVRNLVAEIKPDIVHTHGAKGGVHGRLAAKMAQSVDHPIKAFYCPHGGAMHYDAGSIKGKVFFTVERFMERFTDSMIFVSKYEQKAYHDKVGIPRCPEAIVYNGLPAEEFEPVAENNDAVEFLYIGMMRDLKGPDVFLKALKEVRNKTGRDIKARFVGDGPDKPSYISQIANLGLQEAVSVHAAMPAREAFKDAKIIVVPSRAESMPYLVLEALAAHKTVIATNVGGLPEIFADRSLELVIPGDHQALAQKMLEALDNKKRESQAAEFVKDLKKRFSLPVMAQSVSQIYNR